MFWYSDGYWNLRNKRRGFYDASDIKLSYLFRTFVVASLNDNLNVMLFILSCSFRLTSSRCFLSHLKKMNGLFLFYSFSCKLWTRWFLVCLKASRRGAGLIFIIKWIMLWKKRRRYNKTKQIAALTKNTIRYCHKRNKTG